MPTRPIRRLFHGCCILLAAACSIVHEPAWPEPVPEVELNRTFTREQFAADLAAVRGFIETVHPAAYERAHRTVIDRAEQQALDGIDRPLTRRELAPRFLRFLAAYGDAHTNGWFPQEDLRHSARTGGRFLPFDAVLDGDVVRVEPVYETVKDFEPRDRLLAIDGRPIEAWVDQLAAMKSGPAGWGRPLAVQNLRSLCWLDGLVPPVDVVWEKPAGRRVERSLQGVPWHDRSEGRARATANYSFSVLEGGVGLLDFRCMAGRESWQQQLQQVFTRLREERLAGLVVDLRNNGGGDSNLGVDLLDYLTDRPYRMAARKEWKSSAPYREFMWSRVSAWVRWLPLHWFHSMGRNFSELATARSWCSTANSPNRAPARTHRCVGQGRACS